MSTFASESFEHGQYATFRPSYPPKLYRIILDYHRGPSKLALDLGTGHGLVAGSLAGSFDHVLASDPSAGMIEQARRLCAEKSNITFHQANAEACTFLEDGKVDMVTAAECAHWFDYNKFWPEMTRIIRPGGTIAIFGYKHHCLVDYPRATRVMEHYAEEMDERFLGPYWAQPAHDILSNQFRAVVPPTNEWCDVERIEYEPKSDGPNAGQGTRLLATQMTLGTMLELMRTWSSYHEWQKRWPERQRRSMGGDSSGDLFDEMLEDMRKAEPGLAHKAAHDALENVEVQIEWGSAVILARKR